MTRPLRILAMSDTHDNWPQASSLPNADLLVHAGDLTNYGVHRPPEVLRAHSAMAAYSARYPHILWIPGNHDFGLDAATPPLPSNVHCLLNEPLGKGRFVLAGLTFRGVSLSVAHNMPSLAYTWAHMTVDRDVERQAFDGPACDILVSHSPPYGICDNDGIDLRTKQTCHIGSPELLRYIEREQPRLVICGHSHGGSGEAMVGRTRVVNVATRFELLEVEI